METAIDATVRIVSHYEKLQERFLEWPRMLKNLLMVIHMTQVWLFQRRSCPITHTNGFLREGVGYQDIPMINSMLINKDFQNCLLIGWQHSRQPIRSHVRKFLLSNMDFNVIHLLVIRVPGLGFGVVMLSVYTDWTWFTHILQACFSGIGCNFRFFRYQWSNIKRYRVIYGFCK